MDAKKYAAYALIITGTLTTYFFLSYKGTIIPYPLLLAALCALLTFLGSWFVLRTSVIKNNRFRANINQQIDALKNEGEQIKVMLSECEIRENHYTEERERSAVRTASSIVPLWSALAGEDNTENVAVNQLVMIYTHENDGRKETFYSPTLSLNRTTLLLKLMGRETTTIYRSRTDKDLYYFDLEFLYESR